MEKDVLVILMVAFGLFAIVMFILFFIYLRKYYNTKHMEDDYKKDLDVKEVQEDDIIPSVTQEEPVVVNPVAQPVEMIEPIEPITPVFESVPPVNNVDNNVNETPTVPLNDVSYIEPEEVLETDDIDMEFVPIKKK